ncbi:hypothetical protein DFJ74DRAFT_700549 [Hyaloraphidium curvatum]|nr:hypothetical protein DFJ74DRAFT_700549 [Hyaloraphidium curvatum]
MATPWFAFLALVPLLVLLLWQAPGRDRPLESQGPREPRLLVSLTTTARRLPHIGRTLECLDGQTVKPERTIVWIADSGTAAASAMARAHPRIEFLAAEDVGPTTKLAPALSLTARDPHKSRLWIVTVDDDVAYPNHTLERLRGAAARAERAAALGLSGLRFDWAGRVLVLTENGKMADILEGFAGVAYRRDAFDGPAGTVPPFAEYLGAAVTNPAARASDDLVVSNYLALRGVSRRVVSFPDLSKHTLFAEGRVLRLGEGDDALHKDGRWGSTMLRYVEAARGEWRHGPDF